jgi:hypothetical protein
MNDPPLIVHLIYLAAALANILRKINTVCLHKDSIYLMIAFNFLITMMAWCSTK